MLLQDCACGEPVLDDIRRCPRCGAANVRYRQPRWRTFWPELDDVESADEAIRLGYGGAFLAAGIGAVFALMPGLGPGPAGLADAAVYALCGLGIWRGWRSAAVLAFLLFVANVVLSLAGGGGVGVLAFFIGLGLANGIRGTFARPRLTAAPPSSGQAAA